MEDGRRSVHKFVMDNPKGSGTNYLPMRDEEEKKSVETNIQKAYTSNNKEESKTIKKTLPSLEAQRVNILFCSKFVLPEFFF